MEGANNLNMRADRKSETEVDCDGDGNGNTVFNRENGSRHRHDVPQNPANGLPIRINQLPFQGCRFVLTFDSGVKGENSKSARAVVWDENENRFVDYENITSASGKPLPPLPLYKCSYCFKSFESGALAKHLQSHSMEDATTSPTLEDLMGMTGLSDSDNDEESRTDESEDDEEKESRNGEDEPETDEDNSNMGSVPTGNKRDISPKPSTSETPQATPMDNLEIDENIEVILSKGKGEPKVRCKLCNKIFSTRRNTIRHIKTIHQGEKPFQCPICSKGFFEKKNMEVHLNYHKDSTPSYSCHICHKVYFQKGHLTVHLRTHSGRKSYKCNVCERVFYERRQLARHQRNHVTSK